MPINVELLKKICKAPGAPGFEKEIRELVLSEIEGLCDSVEIDNMGNVTAIKKGRESKKNNDWRPHGRDWFYCHSYR